MNQYTSEYKFSNIGNGKIRSEEFLADTMWICETISGETMIEK